MTPIGPVLLVMAGDDITGRASGELDWLELPLSVLFIMKSP